MLATAQADQTEPADRQYDADPEGHSLRLTEDALDRQLRTGADAIGPRYRTVCAAAQAFDSGKMIDSRHAVKGPQYMGRFVE